MTIWKERRWTTTDNKAIEITVWYHKPDGFDDNRFYGMSAYPVTIEHGFISAECYSGYKVKLFDVTRKSAKADAKAIDTARNHYLEEMIEKVCIKNNLKLED